MYARLKSYESVVNSYRSRAQYFLAYEVAFMRAKPGIICYQIGIENEQSVYPIVFEESNL